jgi:SRSO17 transposase
MTMEEEQIRQLKPRLERYLKRFDDCFARKDTRRHLPVYVEGQLSDLPDKGAAPIAAHAQVAPRTLQEFLSLLKWDEGRMRDRLEEIVAAEHSGPESIGILDETSFVKKGEKTPGVKRQWCGAAGKTENCIVTVHLGYAVGDFHCLLDSELFLPEDWATDPDRCREAGIPETMSYRPKWRIGLELRRQAVENGMRFEWFTFDEGYGKVPAFLRELASCEQLFVGETPKTFSGWIDPPHVTRRPYRRRRGRGRKTPRVVSGSRPPQGVQTLLKRHPQLRDQPWQRYRVKDGEQGPMIWEVKHAVFYAKDPQGLPMGPWRLLIARNALDPKEIKFFVSNAPARTKVQTLLRVGFSRWHVERCFEDSKQEVGLDHYEGRRYLGLKRHLAISAVSYLFLVLVQQDWAGKKSGGHSLPGPGGAGGVDSLVVAGQARSRRHPPNDNRGPAKQAETGGPLTRQPHRENPGQTKESGHQAQCCPPVSVRYKLALTD